MKEIAHLIADHEAIRNGKDIPAERVPSEAEISWILQSAGKHREKAIDVTELEFTLKLWEAYARNRAKFEKMFSIKIDTSCNQRLEFDQLKIYLTKLTGCPLKVREILLALWIAFSIAISDLGVSTRTRMSAQSCTRSTAASMAST